MEDLRDATALALAAATVESVNANRKASKERGRALFPPQVVRSCILVQSMVRRKLFYDHFGEDDLKNVAPPDPLVDVALYFCRRARNPHFVDIDQESTLVAGIISNKQVGLKMSDISEVANFYAALVPSDHLCLTILREKLNAMIVTAQEALQLEIYNMEDPTPAKVKAVIEKCRKEVLVPEDQAERVFSESQQRLEELSAEAEDNFRRALERATTLPEMHELSARLEESFAGVETRLREEIALAKKRRSQFLEMELETRWSSPFAGPLPPHSRAARRYELELGRKNEKVRSFVAEEKRYLAALEANLEVELQALQNKLVDQHVKRREARARSTIADLDERISAINLEIQTVIEAAIVHIGSDNAKVAKRALELLSPDAHRTVYAIQAEAAAEELRREVAACDPSPEAGDRIRGAAQTLENLLDTLDPRHPVQDELRTEFALELAEVAAARELAKATKQSDEIQLRPETPGEGAVLAETLGIDMADPFSEDASSVARTTGGFGQYLKAPGTDLPRPDSRGLTEVEPEAEDPWAMPVGWAEIECAEPDLSLIPRQAQTRRPNGGLPPGLLGEDDGTQYHPGAFDLDPTTYDVMDGFTKAGQEEEDGDDQRDITAKFLLTDITMSFIRKQGEEVFKIKFARSTAEAVSVYRTRLKVLKIAEDVPDHEDADDEEDERPVRVTVAIYKPTDREISAATEEFPVKSAHDVYDEIHAQLQDASSRLRLGELGPFLGEAFLEKGFVSAGAGKMPHGTVSSAYTAPPLAVPEPRSFGGFAGAREMPVNRAPQASFGGSPNFNASTGNLSTVELDGALAATNKAADTLRSAWGASRLEPGSLQATQTFRTTCPNATEDGTTALWARPYDQQPMYRYYSKEKEKQATEPPAKLPKSKQKFTAHATFHVTRHPINAAKPAGGYPAPEHHLAADSWIPEDARKKLVDVTPNSARDLKTKDMSATLSRRKVTKGKKKDKDKDKDGADSEVQSLAGSDGELFTARSGVSDVDLGSTKGSEMGDTAKKKKKKARSGTGQSTQAGEEPEPEAALSSGAETSGAKDSLAQTGGSTAGKKKLRPKASASNSPSPLGSPGGGEGGSRKGSKEKKSEGGGGSSRSKDAAAASSEDEDAKSLGGSSRGGEGKDKTAKKSTKDRTKKSGSSSLPLAALMESGGDDDDIVKDEEADSRAPSSSASPIHARPGRLRAPYRDPDDDDSTSPARNRGKGRKDKKSKNPFGKRGHETEDGGTKLAVPADSKEALLESAKNAFPDAHCWAGMYGGMPGTGTRKLYEEAEGLPELVGKDSSADPLKTPAYVRATYRNRTCGVGPPYQLGDDEKKASPQWTAKKVLDAVIEKKDWRRSYSKVEKIRLGKLGPETNIRLQQSASLPQLEQRQQQISQSQFFRRRGRSRSPKDLLSVRPPAPDPRPWLQHMRGGTPQQPGMAGQMQSLGQEDSIRFINEGNMNMEPSIDGEDGDMANARSRSKPKRERKKMKGERELKKEEAKEERRKKKAEEKMARKASKDGRPSSKESDKPIEAEGGAEFGPVASLIAASNVQDGSSGGDDHSAVGVEPAPFFKRASVGSWLMPKPYVAEDTTSLSQRPKLSSFSPGGTFIGDEIEAEEVFQEPGTGKSSEIQAFVKGLQLMPEADQSPPMSDAGLSSKPGDVDFSLPVSLTGSARTVSEVLSYCVGVTASEADIDQAHSAAMSNIWNNVAEAWSREEFAQPSSRPGSGRSGRPTVDHGTQTNNVWARPGSARSRHTMSTVQEDLPLPDATSFLSNLPGGGNGSSSAAVDDPTASLGGAGTGTGGGAGGGAGGGSGSAYGYGAAAGVGGVVGPGLGSAAGGGTLPPGSIKAGSSSHVELPSEGPSPVGSVKPMESEGSVHAPSLVESVVSSCSGRISAAAAPVLAAAKADSSFRVEIIEPPCVAGARRPPSLSDTNAPPAKPKSPRLKFPGTVVASQRVINEHTGLPKNAGGAESDASDYGPASPSFSIARRRSSLDLQSSKPFNGPFEVTPSVASWYAPLRSLEKDKMARKALPHAAFVFKLHQLNVGALVDNAELKEKVLAACCEVIAEESGEGISKDDVYVEFGPSYGLATALVTPKEMDEDPNVIAERLAKSEQLEPKLKDKILEIEGIDEVLEKEEVPRPPTPVPKPVVGPGPVEPTLTRYETTNSGATKQQVAMFAQSITAAIFRNSNSRAALQQLQQAQQRRQGLPPRMQTSTNAGPSAPATTILGPPPQQGRSLSPQRPSGYPSVGSQPGPVQQTGQRSAGGSTSWSPSRSARAALPASDSKVSMPPAASSLGGPMRLPPGQGLRGVPRAVYVPPVAPKRPSMQAVPQPRLRADILSADDED